MFKTLTRRDRVISLLCLCGLPFSVCTCGRICRRLKENLAAEVLAHDHTSASTWCHFSFQLLMGQEATVNSLSKQSRARRENTVGWESSKHARFNRKYSEGLGLVAVWTRNTRGTFQIHVCLKAKQCWRQSSHGESDRGLSTLLTV